MFPSWDAQSLSNANRPTVSHGTWNLPSCPARGPTTRVSRRSAAGSSPGSRLNPSRALSGHCAALPPALGPCWVRAHPAPPAPAPARPAAPAPPPTTALPAPRGPHPARRHPTPPNPRTPARGPQAAGGLEHPLGGASVLHASVCARNFLPGGPAFPARARTGPQRRVRVSSTAGLGSAGGRTPDAPGSPQDAPGVAPPWLPLDHSAPLSPPADLWGRRAGDTPPRAGPGAPSPRYSPGLRRALHAHAVRPRPATGSRHRGLPRPPAHCARPRPRPSGSRRRPLPAAARGSL